MLSTISRFTDAGSGYAAQSLLNSGPRVPQALKSHENSRPVKDQAVDVYTRADGTEATRADRIGQDSDPARERAAKIRKQLDAKAAEPEQEKPMSEEDKRFRELMHQFVGQVLFGQMLKSMRATQEKNPYFHGGRAEEIFQAQFDMVLTDEMTKSTSKTLSEPMFRLMTAPKNVD